MTSFDAIVVGLGAMGSAAALHLARRGAKVLGLEQFTLAHDRGSSHGESRLIRKAYFESPAYVPLLERAYTLWDELADLAGSPLLHRTGLLLVGREDARGATERARAVAEQYAITVESLDVEEARTRFPQLVIGATDILLWEPGAGYLEVERCVEAQALAAERAGARLAFGERVLALEQQGTTARVVTTRGSYAAGKLIVTAGPWATKLLGALGLPLRVHRVVQSWYTAPTAYEASAGMPCFAYDTEQGFFYGFPRRGGEIKLAEHAADDEVDADTVDRTVREADSARTAAFAARSLRGVGAAATRAKVCLYTMTPDEHFIVDRHEHLVYAAGFSGHGFKFAPVIGESLAELALTDGTTLDLGFLRRRDR
ncbi:MAG: N-methyl-L-tryptophan oxidase [Gammaproteobacteria bacterium]